MVTSMARRKAHRTAPNLPIVAGITLLLGIARIGIAVADHFAMPGPNPSATADSVTIRRTVQLVAFSVEALIAHFGLATPGESQADSNPSAACAVASKPLSASNAR